jgi:mono/diheme cytochrome c family protein
MASSSSDRGIVTALLVVGIFAVAASAQKPPADKPVPTVKSAPAVPLASVDGKENFEAYCAVCHGKQGKGDGPAAPAMKVPVPDLTTIAARNKGKFDPVRVEQIVRGAGKTPTPAHGVETMPIWGDVFRSEDRATQTLRITNLVTYVQSLQAGAGADKR